MAYTEKNYRTKKELIADFKAGKQIRVYQPGGMFDLKNGINFLEGPHYPEPHKWYLQCETQDGIIVRITGVKK